ncbi:unnamed protein product, partial [Prorocentrum cordatum]
GRQRWSHVWDIALAQAAAYRSLARAGRPRKGKAAMGKARRSLELASAVARVTERALDSRLRT